jgi:hypothetical protein
MIYMGSTTIDPEKTIGEIMSLLSRHNISKIISSYEDGQIVGLMFSISFQETEISFKLPVRWEPVLIAMKKDKQTPNHLCTEKQARRVAWRLILRWIEAQLAMAEIGMADIKEVFMPYLYDTKEQKTWYEIMEATKWPMLTRGETNP